VTELTLHDGEGRVASVFATGAPLVAAVGVRVTDAGATPSLRLELRDQTGALIFESETPVESESLSFEIGELALAGGDYDLSLGAAGGPLQRTIRFSVPREPLHGRWRAAVEVPR
jgi:hypothetical protein